MGLRSRRLTVSLAFFVLIFSLGCGRSSAPSTEDPPPKPDSPISKTESEFGEATLFSLKDDELKAALDDKNALSPMPIVGASSFGVRAFRSGQKIFIAPRLFFYGLKAIQRAPGRPVHVRGQVALLDGLSATVPIGLGAVPVPAELRIQNKQAFMEFLKREIGEDFSIASRLPCPKQIRLSTKASESIGGVPSSYPSCRTNIFYPVALIVSEAEWLRLKVSALKPPRTNAGTSTELHRIVTSHSATLRLAQRHIRERLEALTDKMSILPEAEMRSALYRVIGEIFHSLNLPVGFETESLHDELANQFFTATRCHVDKMCYRLVTKHQTLSPSLEVELRKEIPVGKGILLHFEGELTQGLLETHEIFLKAEGGSLLNPPNTGTWNRLSISASEGDIFDFKFNESQALRAESDARTETIHSMVCKAPYSICHHGKWTCTTLDTEMVPRQYCKSSRQECAKRTLTVLQTGQKTVVPIPADHPSRTNVRAEEGLGIRSVCTEIVDNCLSWGVAYDEKRVCDRLPSPALPALPYRVGGTSVVSALFKWDCTRIEENVCDQGGKEDRWRRVTTFSDPHLSGSYVSANISKDEVPRILDALSLGFSWQGPSGLESITCPFGALATEISDDGDVQIEMRNTPSCRPFNDESRKPGNGPSLSILNRAFGTGYFRCGKLVETWDGKRTYTCREPSGKLLEQVTTTKEDEEKLKKKAPLGISLPFYPRLLVRGAVRIVRETSLFGGEK